MRILRHSVPVKRFTRNVLRHYGYEAAYIKERNKAKREPRVMESYLKQDPDDTYILTRLGAIYTEMARYDEAISACDHALSIDPNIAEAHYYLGTVYRQKGMLDEAISEYKQALAIDPTYGAAHHNLALVYFINKQYGLAIKHCDRAVEFGIKADPRFLEDLNVYR